MQIEICQHLVAFAHLAPSDRLCHPRPSSHPSAGMDMPAILKKINSKNPVGSASWLIGQGDCHGMWQSCPKSAVTFFVCNNWSYYGPALHQWAFGLTARVANVSNRVWPNGVHITCLINTLLSLLAEGVGPILSVWRSRDAT